MSRCAGGSIGGQIAKLVNVNIPYHRCHAQFTNGVGQGEGGYQVFCFLGVPNPLWAELLVGCKSVVRC